MDADAVEPSRIGDVARIRVTFVCSGNICRSPSAEVILRSMLAQAGIDGIEVESAGTGDWHAGDDMDHRSRQALVRRGYTPATHHARQFTEDDFSRHDLVVALDQGHFSHLSQLARRAADPHQALDSLVLLRSYDPDAVSTGELDVPDPYYGDVEEFDTVVAQVERACAGLIARLSAAAAIQAARTR